MTVLWMAPAADGTPFAAAAKRRFLIYGIGNRRRPGRGAATGSDTLKRDIDRILENAQEGDPSAAAELLPLVYGELRELARARMAYLPPGMTLQPTALVHEAYLRLIGPEDPGWNNRGHFFAAASLAMRQILVDEARRKGAIKRGGGRKRLDIDKLDLAAPLPDEAVLELDEAISRLEEEDPLQARIVMLRTFAGLTREETAAVLGMSVRTLDRRWRYIIARLHQELTEARTEPSALEDQD